MAGLAEVRVAAEPDGVGKEKSVPVPVTGYVGDGPAALSVIVILPEAAPTAVGWKLTLT